MRADGCGCHSLWWRVLLPKQKPVLGTGSRSARSFLWAKWAARAMGYILTSFHRPRLKIVERMAALATLVRAMAVQMPLAPRSLARP